MPMMVSTPNRFNTGGSSSYSITVYECRFCPRQFNTISEAKKHIESEHPEVLERILVCKICGKKFHESENDKIIKHISKEHPETLLVKCPLCNDTFHKDEEMKFITHLAENHPDELNVILNQK